MEKSDLRFRAALERNFAEANNAILKITAHDRLAEREVTHFGITFFVIVQHALSSDTHSHVMRLLDENSGAASFWYVYKTNEKVALSAMKKAGLDLHELKELSKKVKLVRDKTAFHIDRDSVTEPEDVWRKADIKGASLCVALEKLSRTIAHIKQSIYGGALDKVTEYKGNDVEKILSAYEHFNGVVHRD
jgi:hypothetical protein